MTTSGTYSFSVNRDQIIRMALLNIGKLEESEVPSAQVVADMSMLLNMMIKQWQGKADFAPGLKVWTRKRGHLFLSGSTGTYPVGPTATGWTNSYNMTTTTGNVSAGQTSIPVLSGAGISAGDNIGLLVSGGAVLYWGVAQTVVGATVNLTAPLPAAVVGGSDVFTYTLAAQAPLVVETALLRDDQGNDTPLKIMNVQDYDALPTKASANSQSDPIAIYYETQLGGGTIYTDCFGSTDLSKHIVVTYLEGVQDMNNAGDNPEYPQEWYLPLALGLSKLAAPMFDGQWSTLQEANAHNALAVAQQKDPEKVSLYFQCGEPG